jgi:hypothetical protein
MYYFTQCISNTKFQDTAQNSVAAASTSLVCKISWLYSLNMPRWSGLEWSDVKTQFHECCLWYSKTSINSCTQRWLTGFKQKALSPQNPKKCIHISCKIFEKFQRKLITAVDTSTTTRRTTLTVQSEPVGELSSIRPQRQLVFTPESNAKAYGW